MFGRAHMPALGGSAEWFNSEPLGLADLCGHVVLVNYWTLTCINWLRQGPHLRAWSRAYRDGGLIVTGATRRSPPSSTRSTASGTAIVERGIDYPLAVDNDYEVWSAFDNRHWPALYFVY